MQTDTQLSTDMVVVRNQSNCSKPNHSIWPFGHQSHGIILNISALPVGQNKRIYIVVAKQSLVQKYNTHYNSPPNIEAIYGMTGPDVLYNSYSKHCDDDYFDKHSPPIISYNYNGKPSELLVKIDACKVPFIVLIYTAEPLNETTVYRTITKKWEQHIASRAQTKHIPTDDGANAGAMISTTSYTSSVHNVEECIDENDELAIFL